MAECLQFGWPGYSSVGVNIRLIKTDAREETFQRCIAVTEQLLSIETTTRLVHYVGTENVCVRERNRVIRAIQLAQAQSGVWGLDEGTCTVCGSRIVSAVKVVVVAEIMIQA